MAGLNSKQIRDREQAAIEREHAELKRDELREALLFERKGYAQRGLTDRVRQVDAQLKHHGFEVPRGPKGPREQTDDSSAPSQFQGKAPGGGAS